jgi:TIR domain
MDAASGIALGEKWRDILKKELDSADAMIVILSRAAVESVQNRAEWRVADYKSRRIIPVLVEDLTFEDIPIPLKEDLRLWIGVQVVELGQGYAVAVEKIMNLLHDLEASRDPAVADSIEIERLVNDLLEHRLRELGVTGSKGASETVARSQTVDGHLVFVVTSFRSDMEPAFEAIKCAAQQVGLRAERVKDIGGDYRITEKMIEMIHRAYLIVADLTHERPNVYFELGYARGIGKRVVTIRREGTEVHFDVYDWQHISYIDSRPLEKSLVERFTYELKEDGRPAP